MFKDREHDLADLRREYKLANRYMKKKIEEAALKIRKESGAVRDMRQVLIKEVRKNNVENIKDIHERVSKNSKYQNE